MCVPVSKTGQQCVINNMTETLAHKSLTGHAKENKGSYGFFKLAQSGSFIFLGYREITFGTGKKARLQIDSATGLGFTGRKSSSF